jgi:DNA invertase Pin-like site-specific DNA recombinase
MGTCLNIDTGRNTMKTIAYIRVSTIQQYISNQRLEILEYCRKHDLKVDDFLEVEISSRRSLKERRIDELLNRLEKGDTLIVSELSRLGRSTAEVIDLVNSLVNRHINFVAIKQGLKIHDGKMDMQTKAVVGMFSLFADLERDIISERTKQALAAKKAAGQMLGKPRGTIQKSHLDEKQEIIRELLKHRVAKAAIARIVGSSRTNLLSYIRSRGL